MEEAVGRFLPTDRWNANSNALQFSHIAPWRPPRQASWDRSAIDTAGQLPYTETMTHHHHEAGHGHPARIAPPSLLRMSAAERLIAALAIAGLLWATVWWIMS
jgi:hypothetical protein